MAQVKANKGASLMYVTIALIIVTLVAAYILAPKTIIYIVIDNRELAIPIAYSPLLSTITAVAVGLELLPMGAGEYRLWKVNDRVNRTIPTVIRLIRDEVRSGIPLSRIAELVRPVGGLGALLAEAIGKEVAGIDTLENALSREAERVGNQHLSTMAAILPSILRTGARLGEALDMMYRLYDQVISYYVEKQSQLKPYMMLIYALMYMYIMLVAIVGYLLMPSLGKFSIAGTAPATPVQSISGISIGFFVSVINIGLIVQSLVTGLIIGRMIYGKARSGLIHASILMTTSSTMNYILYQLIYIHHI